MFVTAILLATFLGLLILSVVLWAIFLRIGLRWAKVDSISARRIAAATAIVFAIQIALNVVSGLLSPLTATNPFFWGFLELGAAVVLPCLAIAWVFQIEFGRSLRAWLPTLIPTLAMMLLMYLVVMPFWYEGLYIPTNAMAPTLLGNHWRGTCPKCGRPNYCSPVDPRFPSSEPRRMICENFHVTQSANVSDRAIPGDRIGVVKFLPPRRWDLVVFQYPANPSTLYVKRLVGLPGETIHIEEGAVWVNGRKLAPPEALQGIEYTSEDPGGYGEFWGTKDRPAVLRNDEYFVLGDFSPQSADSRFWQVGAEGHNPFAVPQSHLRGVVAHIYWPPARWRVFR